MVNDKEKLNAVITELRQIIEDYATEMYRQPDVFDEGYSTGEYELAVDILDMLGVSHSESRHVSETLETKDEILWDEA